MASVMLPFAAAGLELGDTTFLMTKAVGSFMKVLLLLFGSMENTSRLVKCSN